MFLKFIALWHQENGKIVLGCLLAVVAILFTPAGEIVERVPAIAWMIALIITLSFVVEVWRAPKQVTLNAPLQSRELLDDWTGKTDDRKPWDPRVYAPPRLVLSDDGIEPETDDPTYCPACFTDYPRGGHCSNNECTGFMRQTLLPRGSEKDPFLTT